MFILFFLLVFFLSLMGDDGAMSFPRKGLVAPSMLDSAEWRQEVKHLSHLKAFTKSIHVRYMVFLY